MRKINVPAVALSVGLLLFVATARLPGQLPELPPVELPGNTTETPPVPPAPTLDPPPALPTLPPSPNDAQPQAAPKTAHTKVPALPEPVSENIAPPLPEPVPKKLSKPSSLEPVPEATPQPSPVPTAEQPVQPTQPPHLPAFRLRSQLAQPTPPTSPTHNGMGSLPSLPPMAIIVERPSALSGPMPDQQTVTASLTLEKKGPVAVQLNQPFPYELVVRNVGTVVAQQVRLEDQLPAGTRFLSAQPPALLLGDRIQWNLEQLAPGAERRFLIEVQPTIPADWKGDATLTVSVAKGWRMAVTGPQLLLNVTGPSSAPVGSKVVFQICVTNSGSAPLTNLLLSDRLPPGLESTQALGSEIERNIGTLAPGETKKIDLETVATEVGYQVNETMITTKEGQKASTRAILNVTEPLLRLRQKGPLRPDLYREHEYHLEVVNGDKVALSHVRLQIVLPEGVQFVSAAAGGVYQAQTRTVHWQIPTLSPGQIRAVTLKMLPQTAGLLVTQAEAHADQGHDTTLFSILHACASEAVLPTAHSGVVNPVGGRVP